LLSADAFVQLELSLQSLADLQLAKSLPKFLEVHFFLLLEEERKFY
jgi:hypothetical protein